jgi:predicted nucleic acid-binding protein
MSEVLVVNASPLIFLGNAGRIELLRAGGARRVVVPEAVFNEVNSGGHADAAARALSEVTWLERGPATDIPAAVIEWDLGAGESSVIATALELPGASAVIDDLNGRRCCRALGIGVIGTLGVIVSAHRKGAIGDPRAVLFELRAAGMWLSDAVIARVLRIAGIANR